MLTWVKRCGYGVDYWQAEQSALEQLYRVECESRSSGVWVGRVFSTLAPCLREVAVVRARSFHGCCGKLDLLAGAAEIAEARERVRWQARLAAREAA